MSPLVETVWSVVRSVGGPIAVVGDGPVADEVRAAVANPPGIWPPRRNGSGNPTGRGTRPAAVIELTGTGAGIAEALALVDDLDTVVLAGPLPETGVVLDLYADAHVRGLRIVGVDPWSVA